MYLTDHPERAGALAPAIGDWRTCGPNEVAGALGAIARVACMAGPLWMSQPDADENAVAGAANGNGLPRARPIAIVDDACGSQFQAMVDALKAGEALPDGLVCLALSGRDFRGQRGRRWEAIRGNLHLTAHYRVNVAAATAQAGLTMLPAVAAARTVAVLVGERFRPSIKWVNDVLVDGAKVAGVLTQTHLEGDRITRVVLGVGVNIARAPVLAANPGVVPAGALAQFEPTAAQRLPEAFDLLVRHLDEGMSELLRGGTAALYDAYRSRAGFLGRSVRIWPEAVTSEPSEGVEPSPVAAGRVSDLLPDLSLMIEGLDEPVRKGRMELLPG